MNPPHSAAGPHVAEVSDFRIVRRIDIADTTYELAAGTCKCGEFVYRLIRSCGAALSVYQISEEDCANLDEYVATLHESFSIDVVTKLNELRETIDEYNSKGLFQAEQMQAFGVRLIDKARLICNRLSKNGVLLQILQEADDPENDFASAFILGCIATENHWLRAHEDAVFEGYAHIEGREAGRPLALAARIRQGKRTRKAVLRAASKLYAGDPSLLRNDSKTASQIVGLKIRELQKRDGTYLGTDAIIKHLRAARQPTVRQGKSVGISETGRKSV